MSLKVERDGMAFTFKGGMLPMTVMELASADPEHIREQLAGKLSQSPAFFHHTPVVLNVEHSMSRIWRSNGSARYAAPTSCCRWPCAAARILSSNRPGPGARLVPAPGGGSASFPGERAGKRGTGARC